MSSISIVNSPNFAKATNSKVAILESKKKLGDNEKLAIGKWHYDVEFANYLSWRAGGRVKRCYIPKDLADLQLAMQQLYQERPNEEILMVGLGSNLLIRDGGFSGAVFLLHAALKKLIFNENSVYVEAGVSSPKFAISCAKRGLSGAEFLSGVPGTIGGALAMNAGCYNGETWDLVTEVFTLNRQGEVFKRIKEQFSIAYRHVHHAEHDNLTPREEWFVAANIILANGNAQHSQQQIKQWLTKRRETQPLQWPNCGSVFRNPENDYAARLIEACGLKGIKIGGAEISEKHANFIINKNKASASDIENLIELIEKKVNDRYSIRLHREVRIVGNH